MAAGVRLPRASAAAALCGMLALAPAHADLKLPPRPRGDPPMRILRVTSVDPSCAPNCPQWISAEGRITPGIAGEFQKAIADLKGRRLPILLSSRGGSVEDAIAMGTLIREKRLAVAVARTLVADCPPHSKACPPDAHGEAITGGAICASACPLILAGGVERLAGPAALIGVHQITTVVKAVEGVEHLTSVHKFFQDTEADTEVQRYLTLMGVGQPVMTLLRRTPPSGIRWLSPAELRESAFVTEALDPEAPMLASGANGLNARSFDGAPAGVFTAQGTDGAFGVAASLSYRRGGGALALALSPTGGRALPPDGWSVGLAGLAPIGVPSTGGAVLTRAALCEAGAFALTAAEARPRREATVPLATMDGGKALTDEMCP